MQDTYENALFSRRAFVQLGSVALMAVGTSCTSQPSSQSAKTQPASSGTGSPPSPPAKTAKEINGTAPNTALSKQYVQTIGRFAYLWGWPMVNSFNRRTGMTSAPEPGFEEAFCLTLRWARFAC